MGYLERMWAHPRVEGELLIGTVMSPSVMFSDFPGKQYPTRDEHLELVGTFQVRGHDVLVTRMGGLFIRPPAHFSDLPPGATISRPRWHSRPRPPRC